MIFHKSKIFILSLIFVLLIFAAYLLVYHSPLTQLLNFLPQVTKERIGSFNNLQPKSQKGASYVGSSNCAECHQEIYDIQVNSMHTKMIQDVKKDPSVIVADFPTLPEDADFELEKVVYTIGSKFKQRYMLRKDRDGKENYRIGNYQWNTETKKWQNYSVFKDWYHDAWPEDNNEIPTSHTCDGCHFTGYMSTATRVEPGINCENCHGPGSYHIENDIKENIYVATRHDPIRAMEVCTQCHMRNVDKRLDSLTIKQLYSVIKDYADGFEPGMSLTKYKKAMPYKPGVNDAKFYGNGIGVKNRMQGNEYVQSTMYKHGITCMNCHDPHSLDNTAQNSRGDEFCMSCHKMGSVLGPHQSTLTSHTKHKAESTGSSCIECHMPKTGKHTGKSPITVRTHVFRFIYPKESMEYGVSNACNNCHQDKSLEWSDKMLTEWGMTSWERQ
jgi:hypothetical protein